MSVSNRETFYDALLASLPNAPGIVVVHSSLVTLAPPNVLDKWDVLFAVDRLVRQGWTLVFPAFTFSFTSTGRFDVQHTPSETGVFADWVFQGLPSSLRTQHPIYSFVVIGPMSQEIAACPSKTTFGNTSPFKVFEEHDARIVMLGAGWTYCTPFHRYEELAEVPYRYFKTFSGQLIDRGISSNVNAAMYVRDLDLAAQNDWQPLVRHMQEQGSITEVPLWRGNILSANMSAIRFSAQTLLAADPLAFTSNAAEVRHRRDMAGEAARLPSFRIALLGSSNLDIAGNELEASLEKLMPGRKSDIFVPPFGQMAQQIMMPQSELADFNPELTIAVDRIEDLLGAPSLDLVDQNKALDASQLYGQTLCHFAETNGSTLVVHKFAVTGRHDLERTQELRDLIDQCNAVLDAELKNAKTVLWIDMAAETTSGIATWDARLWHLGRIPFSKDFTQHIVIRWTGIILAQLGKTARLLVLDLDHTMWGGVLGEDGPEGILIGGDFPGNAFSHFQKTIKNLSERGVALAVSSKNDEDLALDVLQNHAAMIIRPDDLVSHRINWQPKWQNIRDIAAELDLGLGSVLFIDDNPVEREAVKRNLPMVHVLELPQDPTAYTETLLSSPFVEVLQTGKEDRKRVASYKARKKINHERNASANVEDFLLGLEMNLFIQPLSGDNITRAAQLCQKTNQFNTTTRRHSARDLEAMRDANCDVAVIGLQDKFSDRENIGLIILKPDSSGGAGDVDLFLLSCRVLGRTVEQAVLDWAVSRAKSRGWETLRGDIVETPRNTPARKVFESHGFQASSKQGQWHRVAETIVPPTWFKIHNDFLRF